MHDLFAFIFETVLELGASIWSWRFVATMFPAVIVSAYGFYLLGTPVGWFILAAASPSAGGLGVWWARRCN